MHCTAEREAETGTYLLIKGLSLAHVTTNIIFLKCPLISWQRPGTFWSSRIGEGSMKGRTRLP